MSDGNGALTNGNGAADKQPKKQRAPGRPWKPGQSGNPKGRPPKPLAMADAYNARLDSLDPVTGMRYRQLLANRTIDDAINSEIATPAAREVRQATDGDKMTVTQTEPFESDFVVQREDALADLAARSTHDRDDAGTNGNHRGGS